MFANKVKINITTISSASTATTINIPINLEYQLVDQAELVERVFVETEVANSINPIFDYEKVRLAPTLASLTILTGATGTNTNIGLGTVGTGIGAGLGTLGIGPVGTITGSGGFTTIGSGLGSGLGVVGNNVGSGGFTTVGSGLSFASPTSLATSLPATLVAALPVSLIAPITTSVFAPAAPVSAFSPVPATPSASPFASAVPASTPASPAPNNFSANNLALSNSSPAVSSVGVANAASLSSSNINSLTPSTSSLSAAAINGNTLPVGGGNAFVLIGGGLTAINSTIPITNNDNSCGINLGGNHINNIVYSISFLTGTPPAIITTPSTYSQIGFTDNDMKFETNAFKNSFLDLLFYDSDNALEQRLISYITLFPNLTANDLTPFSATTGFPGQPKAASEIPVTFVITNPLIPCHLAVSEGFFLYDYKDTIPMGGFKYLYMRATYNNAKTGKPTNLMVDDNPYTIDNLINKLYTRYILVRNQTGFYYKIDDTYNLNTSGNNIGKNNVTISNNNIVVNLYQIQSL